MTPVFLRGTRELLGCYFGDLYRFRYGERVRLAVLPPVSERVPIEPGAESVEMRFAEAEVRELRWAYRDGSHGRKTALVVDRPTEMEGVRDFLPLAVLT